MTYKDAKDYLHIADNAYNAEAYAEAAEILEKVAYAVKGDGAMPKSQREELVEEIKLLIARFQFCPDECSWEDVSSLNDLFGE